MNSDIVMLFEKMPGTLPIYEELERRILARFSDVTIQVKKTQVSFYNTHAFAWAWPPFRKRRGWPDVYMLVTFGLDHQMQHPRIAEAVEPYPNRWTHHVIVERAEEIDEELLGWLEESYLFSLSKGRGKRKQAMAKTPAPVVGAHSEADLEAALTSLSDMIDRSQKAQEKFRPGSSQHSLQRNRIHALSVASRLIAAELDGGAALEAFTKAELESAQAPLLSLLGKSEKSLTKLKEGTWQHRMLVENLKALALAIPLLSKALQQCQ